METAYTFAAHALSQGDAAASADEGLLGLV
jgi:hypothetical protein